MADYVGALDQGTTSTRFMIFDHSGQVVGIDQKEHEQIYPKPGWSSTNANEIWTRTRRSSRARWRRRACRRRHRRRRRHEPARDHRGVEKATGKPIHNAIVWQDTRTDQICNELAKTGARIGLQSEDRSAPRDLLLRAQGEVDPRQRRGREG